VSAFIGYRKANTQRYAFVQVYKITYIYIYAPGLVEIIITSVLFESNSNDPAGRGRTWYGSFACVHRYYNTRYVCQSVALVDVECIVTVRRVSQPMLFRRGLSNRNRPHHKHPAVDNIRLRAWDIILARFPAPVHCRFCSVNRVLHDCGRRALTGHPMKSVEDTD
jgi:hypothetical protein